MTITLGALIVIIIALIAIAGALSVLIAELRQKAANQELQTKLDAQARDLEATRRELERLRKETTELSTTISRLIEFHTKDFERDRLKAEVARLIARLKQSASQSVELAREIGEMEEKFDSILERIEEPEAH